MLTQLLATFIIQDCQPFSIIESPSFVKLVRGLEPGFAIPCIKTMKKMIRDAFNWSSEQLLGMISSGADTINFTTDLWTSRRNDSYIGITANWVDKDFVVREAVLSCELLPSPHTAENIRDALLSVFEHWKIRPKVFAATTDNGSNVLKAIRLMGDVQSISCAAHTLHLSVTKGLAQVTKFIKRVKNLMMFFTASPKQNDRLRAAQEQCGFVRILDVQLDVKTRWNSALIAWKRLNELRRPIQYLANTLHLSQDWSDKEDGDYLEKIVLTLNEWV
jgi:hypothetical protein